MKTDSLRRIAARVYGKSNADSLNNAINLTYNQLLSERQSFARDFVDSNASSISVLAAIQSLDPEKDMKSYLRAEKELVKLYPNSEYVKNFSLQVVKISKLAIGSEAPQIILNNPNSVTIPLASLRGKVVLVDFWASWCKPCRIENPNVVRLYNKYKDKGFEIYGVSLDKTKESWVNAIRQDGLEWTQVSDLKFWNSSVVKLYDIKSIPQTYLLDEYGIIIAKGVRGKALESKLAEILGEA
jgi:peroxiredoxin